MKINLVNTHKSTFETTQKDLFKIAEKIMGNEKLKKLLYHTTRDALTRPELTDEQTLGLLHENVRVIPQLVIDKEVKSYIVVTFDNFCPNDNNPEYRDNLITFDVLCDLDIWVMDNYNLRPYLIMGEIDGMLNNKKLNGIGTVDFVSANQLLLSEDLAGFTLVYRVINDV